MKALLDLVRSEPVAVSALVAALLTLLVTFNVIGSNSVNPILGVIAAALALAGGAVVRSVVTPVTATPPESDVPSP